ncbi:MAG: hypothetical protein JSV56_08985 [Methanomassiliicoccales archaeon]|nr:MAG: hypothetical protein JSV56_08985 [Methanomassiliicoccales archaeon]
MNLKDIAHEFKHHFPFTVFSAAAGIIIVSIIFVILTSMPLASEVNETADGDEHEHEEGFAESTHRLFHVFHPIHCLFSASATTAMFWRYDKRLLKSILIGLLGSLAFCGISDIFLPFIGGSIIGLEMELHICLVDHPLSVVPFAVFGVIAGLTAAEVFTKRSSTIFSHSGHVFVSTMASILYLTTFGFMDWMENMFIVFIIVVLAVLIPCCTSDVIFPLLLVDKKDKHFCGGECEE